MRLKTKITSLKLHEHGDTVVEVLISIALVSLVLSGAFVTANRSLQATRGAQERQNALKMVEAQVEQLKYLSGASPDAIFGSSVPASFCIKAGIAVASSDAGCRVNAAGISTTAVPAYNLTVTRATNLFTVRASWDNVRGTGQDLVEIKYRVYQ